MQGRAQDADSVGRVAVGDAVAPEDGGHDGDGGVAGRVVSGVAGGRGSHACRVAAGVRRGVAAVGASHRVQGIVAGQACRRLGEGGGELADREDGEVPLDLFQAGDVLVQAGQRHAAAPCDGGQRKLFQAGLVRDRRSVGHNPLPVQPRAGHSRPGLGLLRASPTLVTQISSSGSDR